MGKSPTARDLAVRCGASVLPVDAIWYALKAATNPTLYPELHYFDPPDSEWRRLGAEYWCERHIRSAIAISLAMGPVIEYYLSEEWPVRPPQRPLLGNRRGLDGLSVRETRRCRSTKENSA